MKRKNNYNIPVILASLHCFNGTNLNQTRSFVHFSLSSCEDLNNLSPCRILPSMSGGSVFRCDQAVSRLTFSSENLNHLDIVFIGPFSLESSICWCIGNRRVWSSWLDRCIWFRNTWWKSLAYDRSNCPRSARSWFGSGLVGGAHRSFQKDCLNWLLNEVDNGIKKNPRLNVRWVGESNSERRGVDGGRLDWGSVQGCV